MLQLNLQRPKVDKYDAHYFVVLPAFRLTDAAFDMMSKWNIKDPDLCDLWDSQKDDTPGGTVLVEKQNYCLCVAGPNRSAPEFSYDTVISVEAGYSPMIPITSQGKTPHQSVQSTRQQDTIADTIAAAASKTSVVQLDVNGRKINTPNNQNELNKQEEKHSKARDIRVRKTTTVKTLGRK